MLNPAGKVSDEVASDADMAGPLIIAMFLGFLLLAVRPWGAGGFILSSLSLWLILTNCVLCCPVLYLL